MQSTNEQIETSNEDLRSTNEEQVAANDAVRHHSEGSTAYRLQSEAVLGSIGLGVIVRDRSNMVLSGNKGNEVT